MRVTSTLQEQWATCYHSFIIVPIACSVRVDYVVWGNWRLTAVIVALGDIHQLAGLCESIQVKLLNKVLAGPTIWLCFQGASGTSISHHLVWYGRFVIWFRRFHMCRALGCHLTHRIMGWILVKSWTHHLSRGQFLEPLEVGERPLMTM
jgi:hypothetical protein